MSRFDHPSCVDCWNANHPRRAVSANTARYTRGPAEVCCWCNRVTHSGIYIRLDPENIPCHGNHSEDL